ncbi:tetratricopeptide repeat protein [Virgibacillus sp. YIM 98842]|uniref:tetratricopeptide repeat protein n=1 Tax=Virgibacillus sp. YIM 98842 TaxID=2663533 RepID=UPI0013DB78CA|nr:tetratricopeptide repeat protein [Virgibacillus sp. YIM 98842]
MGKKAGNVVLFPKWKISLEESSLQAMKEKRYEDALEKLDELLSYKVNHYEIIVGKIICLMELNRYNEAQNICEDMLQHKNDDYYHYLHIYLTLLFQTNQYEILMEQVEEELSKGSLPPLLEEQSKELYELSIKMKADVIIGENAEYTEGLRQAIHNENHLEQWGLVEKLRKSKAQPDKHTLSILKEEQIHPVVKTAIFQWLQESAVKDKVHIRKLGLQLKVKPTEVTELKKQNILKETVYHLEEMEQQNPSLMKLLNKILYRYIYVRYPIMPPSEDAGIIAHALIHIGKEYISPENNSITEPDALIASYLKEINLCESLFLSIIDE